MKYLKVWTDFVGVLDVLEDVEAGRLFRAMLHYAETGEEPESLAGNERYVWPVAKRDIDHASRESKTLRENGMKGGRPKTKENQTKPTETNGNQSEPNKSQKEKKRNEMKGNEKKGNEKEGFLDIEDAKQIAEDHDRILEAAEDAGFKMSNNVRASLIALYADNGLEKVLAGLRSCSEHGAPTLAYLRACMRDEPRKVITAKPAVTAQAYTQRDYEGEQEDAMRRMLRVVSE